MKPISIYLDLGVVVWMSSTGCTSFVQKIQKEG